MADDLKFDFEETIRLFAAGLCEREQTKTEDDIPFSGKMPSGISRPAVLAFDYSREPLSFHETMFITNYACKSVCEWFLGWNEEYVDIIKQSDYYNLGEFSCLSRLYTEPRKCQQYPQESEVFHMKRTHGLDEREMEPVRAPAEQVHLGNVAA